MSYRRPGTTRRDQNDVESLHNLVMDLRDAVRDLETEKDTLRQAVRKLKIENRRTRDKVKNLCAHLKSSGLEVASDDDDFPDYDEIGRDFILIGGSHDPLDARYEATIKDADGVEYKTAERYYWAKMAAHFKDEETRKKILDAPNTTKAEAAVMDMKNFDEKEWDKHKLQTWQDGQRLKFEQHRWITSVLVATGKVYIAVCHQDKQIGTGWRKNREESGKTLFWDGKNLGGKFLMNLRKKSSDVHEWKDGEEEEINNRLNSLKRYVWRRIDNRYQQQRYSTPIYNCRGRSAPRSNYTNNNNNNNNNGKPSHVENGSGDKTSTT